MNTKSFFGERGLTSTSANYYANIAKEEVRNLKNWLDNVKFVNTSINVIGAEQQTSTNFGKPTTDFQRIKNALERMSQLHSLIAFFREAIKEKERLSGQASEWLADDRRAELDKRHRELAINKPVRGKYLTELDVVESWSIGEQEKYLSLEAEASVYGKYIHEDGAISKARVDLIKVLSNPVSLNVNGRDTIIYNFEPTASEDEVDGLFFELQNHYRTVQAELNGMKKSIADSLESDKLAVDEKYRTELQKWNSEMNALDSEYNELSEFERAERMKLSKQVQELKIVVPNRLTDIFNSLKEL